MKSGYIQFGNSYYHQSVDILEEGTDYFIIKTAGSPPRKVHVDTVKVLPEDHLFVYILWANGWDEYVIRLDKRRKLTDKEFGDKIFPVVFDGPTYGSVRWLKESFIYNMVSDNAYLIVKHVAGGN